MGSRSGDSAEPAVALVRGHLEAWMRGDIDAMDAFTGEDFIQWHSMIGKEHSKAEHRALLHTAKAAMQIDYHDVSYVPITGGVLVECLADITSADGTGVRDVPFGMVYLVSGGKIRRCDEYIDGQSLPVPAAQL